MIAPSPRIAPSMLSADFARLGAELAIVDPGRDWLHCDVMDQHFVPNLTFGPMIIEAANRLTEAPLDVHLMIERPWETLAAFRAAGADHVIVHFEACPQPAAVLRAIRATGASAGLAIKPGTSYAAAAPLLPELDQLLVMTVEPGFGGQEFMPAMLEKVRAAAADRDRLGLAFAIEVDGGIHHDTIGAARAAGADVFVAGHAIFHAPQPIRALEALRTAVGA